MSLREALTFKPRPLRFYRAASSKGWNQVPPSICALAVEGLRAADFLHGRGRMCPDPVTQSWDSHPV